MRERESPKWWLRRGVRARSALAAVLVMTAALALAGTALLWILQRSLQSAADNGATSRAMQLSARVAADSLNRIDPILLATDGSATVIQVVDTTGRVVLSSADSPRTPLVDVQLAPGDQQNLGSVSGTTVEGNYRVTAQGVRGVHGRYTVLIGTEQDEINGTLSTVATLLLLGFPIIALIGGAATYALVGRSLKSVDRMRSQVAAISTSDLSERVAVPVARDEIARLATTMNAMLSRIEIGQAAQRRFVSDASHELRSPLATVTTALEFAAGRPDVLEPTLVRGTLLPEAHRMRYLVEDLLLLARADESGIPLQLGDVDVDDILDHERLRLQSIGTVRVLYTVRAVRVLGDATKLARVMRNLADNAARHAHSTVSMTADYAIDFIVVTVSDDGPGVPESEHQRIFERFVRLDTGRARAAGGSGLGLAIVAEIVAAHGGSTTVESPIEGGARFVVRLPIQGPAHPSPASNR